jgi:hypothetical protein
MVIADQKLDVLSAYEPISLSKMDSVKLLNRMDTKFIFNKNLLPEVLGQLLHSYRILEIEGQRMTQYRTLYYDTPDFNNYFEHHNGKLDRYKVRLRQYVNSGQVFFEIKFKNNKKRTIKTRMEAEKYRPEIDCEEALFLGENSPFHSSDLVPVLTVNYARITFVSKQLDERVTVDINLSFEKGQEHKSYENLVIAEIKQNRCHASPFTRRLHQLHVNELRVSKYCLGALSLYPDLKRNNFKPKVLTINRILACRS